MNQDNAVAEALADRLAVLFDAYKKARGGSFDEDAFGEQLLAEVVSNAPTIIAALKAQRVDEGGVS